MEIERIHLPQSKNDILYIVNWKNINIYEQLSKELHPDYYFEDNASFLKHIVCIIKIKWK